MLIVDDDRQVARSLARRLAKDAHVTVAHSGAEALAIFGQGRRFDLVLCDVMMPTMTGPALLEQASREHPGIDAVFVFMTGGLGADEMRRIEQLGVECLSKPVEVAAIRARIAAKRR